ncbi:AzlD domain-containing protein [Alkaliphilus transvaalensis]|uniref:AzlD domain-containing protein n=1 Tax=Alkaliphilus transvaalensis TaxID=114628 RepID=UPI000479B1E5|nr:AzlD domain-containing protein [Alkaliphilus transvaalensis]
MNNTIILIIGMMVVTYIPRLIPFNVLGKGELPPKLKRFLLFIPYTALGALIIPGVFTAIPDQPIAVLLAVAFAAFFAWVKGEMIIPVLGAIIVVYGYLTLFS